MFEYVCAGVICGVVGFVAWKGGASERWMAGTIVGPAVLARASQVQQREDALKHEAFLQAAAKFAHQGETSPMEARLTGSLKSIREQAEQAMFAASETERARYLAAIWSMAACDLDDDGEQRAH